MKAIINRYLLSSPKIKKDYKFVCLSDIHSNIMNLELIRNLIIQEKPECIILAGDTFDNPKHKDNQAVADFINQLAKQYLVIFARGNHEEILENGNKDFFKNFMKESKCIFVDKMQKGYKLRDDIIVSSFNLPMTWYEESREDVKQYLQGIKKNKYDKNYFNILVSHSPNGLFGSNHQLYQVPNIDLILSGHNHGGLTPMWLRKLSSKNRALIGPYRRLLKANGYGHYSNGISSLIISDGVTKAGHYSLPNETIDNFVNELYKIDFSVIKLTPGQDHLLNFLGREKINLKKG